MVANKNKLLALDFIKKTLFSVFFYAFSLSILSANELKFEKLPVCFPQKQAVDVVVAKVIDGDTFSLIDGRVVKILGLEAPEFNFQEPSYSENGAVEAYNFLQQLLPENELVRLYFDEKKQDRYGRILAHVLRVNEKIDVAAHLLKNGWARQVIYPPNQTSWQCYQVLEEFAQKQHAGLWRHLRYWPRITDFIGKQDAGYVRLQGKVTALERNRRYLWLVLDSKVWLGFKLDDFHYFPKDFPLQLLHKQVDVRGWLYYSHDKLRIRIRHPQQITLH